MTDQMSQETIYVCPKCTTGWPEPGDCPDCGVERVECESGNLDDPCRRPIMSKDGDVETHAPVWWLRARIRWLADAALEIRR